MAGPCTILIATRFAVITQPSLADREIISRIHASYDAAVHRPPRPELAIAEDANFNGAGFAPDDETQSGDRIAREFEGKPTVLFPNLGRGARRDELKRIQQDAREEEEVRDIYVFE